MIIDLNTPQSLVRAIFWHLSESHSSLTKWPEFSDAHFITRGSVQQARKLYRYYCYTAPSLSLCREEFYINISLKILDGCMIVGRRRCGRRFVESSCACQRQRRTTQSRALTPARGAHLSFARLVRCRATSWFIRPSPNQSTRKQYITTTRVELPTAAVAFCRLRRDVLAADREASSETLRQPAYDVWKVKR